MRGEGMRGKATQPSCDERNPRGPTASKRRASKQGASKGEQRQASGGRAAASKRGASNGKRTASGRLFEAKQGASVLDGGFGDVAAAEHLGKLGDALFGGELTHGAALSI